MKTLSHTALLRWSAMLLIAVKCPASHAQLSFTLGNSVLLVDEVLDTGRVNIPWEILWGPDDRLWMTDGPLITRWDPQADVVDTLYDRGSGNGLGLVLHPNFPQTPFVFAVFDTSAYYAGGNRCDVIRLSYDALNDTLIQDLTVLHYAHYGEHAGGRLLFDTTGHVLLTTADYYFHGPDTLFNNMGKTLRFAVDGSVPPDNPRPDFTWTYGHRNPQGLALLPNGAVVNSEHGQAAFGNEINQLLPGGNYGWPFVDGVECFEQDSCDSPTFIDTPPLTVFVQPPSGCAYYASSTVPELTGKIVTCVLWQTGLLLSDVDLSTMTITNTEHLSGGIFDELVRIRDIAIRPDGSFCLITNDRQEARIRWVHPDISEAMQEDNGYDDIRVRPVPADDFVDIELGDNSTTQRAKVFDAIGRECLTVQRIGNGFRIPLTGLPAGEYFVRMDDARVCRLLKR